MENFVPYYDEAEYSYDKIIYYGINTTNLISLLSHF